MYNLIGAILISIASLVIPAQQTGVLQVIAVYIDEDGESVGVGKNVEIVIYNTNGNVASRANTNHLSYYSFVIPYATYRVTIDFDKIAYNGKPYVCPEYTHTLNSEEEFLLIECRAEYRMLIPFVADN